MLQLLPIFFFLHFLISTFILNFLLPFSPPWVTADVEIRSPYVENLELSKVLPLKTGVGQKIPVHTTATAKIFFFFAYVGLSLVPVLDHRIN